MASLRWLLAMLSLAPLVVVGVPVSCASPDRASVDRDAGPDAEAIVDASEVAPPSAGGAPAAGAGTSGSAGDLTAGAGAGAGGAGGVAVSRPDAGSDAGPDAAAPAGCVADVECSENRLARRCDLGSGDCVECLSSVDCAATLSRRFCDSTRGACLECRATADCPLGTYCSSDGRCTIGCAVDGDCDVPGPAAPDAGANASDAGSPDAGGGRTGMRCRQGLCEGCLRDADCWIGTRCLLGRCENSCGATSSPCPSGFECCFGVCRDTSDDPMSCGACGQPCTRPGSIEACVEGVCEVVGCSPGFADCDDEPSNGCEVDTRSRADHCAGCGNVCTHPDNAEAACKESRCTLGECVSGFADCDDEPTNGCEVDLRVTESHCGVCDATCALESASAVCRQAACTIEACTPGHRDCNLDPNDGCEVDTRVSPLHCGACGNVCARPSSNVACEGFRCVVTSCEPPAADCDGVADTGCEVDTSVDLWSCGGCGRACNLSHATARCSGGGCAVESCDAGWADCDGDAANGCETDTETDVRSCGACGVACSTNHTIAVTCVLGACALECEAPFQSCDGEVATGCESDTLASVDHCGGCGASCPLTSGQTAWCAAGVCGASSGCSVSTADCNADPVDGCEVDTGSDASSCGGCGSVCALPNAVARCTGGACEVATCQPGFGDCTAANGCETALNSLGHCGDCDTPCALSNATSSCVTGACAIAFCASPFASCDGVDANGCEEDTSSSVEHCGACGNACSANHGAPLCTDGSCEIACTDGFADCDASAGNGCETGVSNDAANCGECGRACAVRNGTARCDGGVCGVATCKAPFADCDGEYSTGCETNTDRSGTHCGSCGGACDLPNAITACRSGVCRIDGCVSPFRDCDGLATNGCEAIACP